MKAQEVYTSFQDFQRKYFPNKVLDRLDETLCSLLELSEDYQHRLSKSKENPKVGSVEVAKPAGYFRTKSTVEETVKKFYKEEGFEVSTLGFVHARRDKEHYRIFISESDTSWVVNVDKEF